MRHPLLLAVLLAGCAGGTVKIGEDPTTTDDTLAPGFGATFNVVTTGGASWSIDNGVGAVTTTTTSGVNTGTKAFTVPPGTPAGPPSCRTERRSATSSWPVRPGPAG